MIKKTLGALLFAIMLVAWANGRTVPPGSRKLPSKWKPLSIFFGVNRAWSLTDHSDVTLTYLARDQLRPFKLSDFPRSDYASSLTELRSVGLAPIGISQWTIEGISYHDLTSESLLVKVWGHYQRGDKKISFHEWQHFTPEYYGQVNLISGEESHQEVLEENEREELFKKVLKL